MDTDMPQALAQIAERPTEGTATEPVYSIATSSLNSAMDGRSGDDTTGLNTEAASSRQLFSEPRPSLRWLMN